MLPVAWCICLPSCPCQGANAYQVAHLKMLTCAKLPIATCRVAHSKVRLGAKDSNDMVHPCTKLPNARCHCVPMFPIACAPSEKNCSLQGAIVCVWFHCKVPLYAKFPVAGCHRVPRMPIVWCICVPTCPRQVANCMPILPIARCHRVPILPICLCHNVPRDVIAWFTRAPSCPPPFAKLAKSRCHRVPSYPS